jgi:hypothetical protein
VSVASKMLPIIHFSFDIFMSFYYQFLNTNGCWINYFFHLPWNVFVYENKIFQNNNICHFVRYQIPCVIRDEINGPEINYTRKISESFTLYYFLLLNFVVSDIFLPVESYLDCISAVLIICIKLWLFNHAVFNFLKPQQGKENVYFLTLSKNLLEQNSSIILKYIFLVPMHRINMHSNWLKSYFCKFVHHFLLLSEIKQIEQIFNSDLFAAKLIPVMHRKP